MSKTIRVCLLLCSVSLTLGGCGMLLDQEPLPIVVTKVKEAEKPLLVDPRCPKEQRPKLKPKPADGNDFSADAAEFIAEFFAYTEACEINSDAAAQALEKELDAILRPSKEALRPTQ